MGEGRDDSAMKGLTTNQNYNDDRDDGGDRQDSDDTNGSESDDFDLDEGDGLASDGHHRGDRHISNDRRGGDHHDCDDHDSGDRPDSYHCSGCDLYEINALCINWGTGPINARRFSQNLGNCRPTWFRILKIREYVSK